MTPNPNPSPELLPCPFCSGEAAIQLDRGRGTVGVGCTKCTACQPPSWDIASETWARRAWNTRTLSQTLPAPGEVEAILKTAQADCGCRIPAPFDEVAEHAIGLALATVAAANDEAFARGVETAAKVADEQTRLNVQARRDRADDVLAFEFQGLGDVIAAAIRLLSQGGGKAERYRHVKRGSVYEVVGRAELQVNNIALTDGVTMVVYRGEGGKLWARGEAEFRDGRFELVASSDDASGVAVA